MVCLTIGYVKRLASEGYAVHSTIEKLLATGPVVTDGAWGTQLQERGLPFGACPDAWNLTQPDKVEQVAHAYVEAESRVILANTFGANRFILARHGLADRVAEINRAGVEISLRAANRSRSAADHGAFGQRPTGRQSSGQFPSGQFPRQFSPAEKPAEKNTSLLSIQPVIVFASMGPSGIMLMMGQASEAELRAAFAEQARAMADAGAQGIVIETMSDPAEAALATAAAHETGLPTVACMTFDSGAKKDRTMMGATPEQAAEQLVAAGADVIGSNCGHGVADMVEICRRLRAATDRPIWIKANAGLPEMIDGRVVYRQTPAEFAAYAPRLVEAGASFIGGCCGTTPEFIRAVVERLEA